MASVRELKRRIKSVKNISQVTRAMQMIAASRMRRAQEQALASRPYAAKAWELLTHFASQGSGNVGQLHPLLAKRDVIKNVAIILVSADKGLAGGYNGNVIRTATRYMRENNHEDASLITVGRKGRDFMIRYGRKVIADFTDLPPRPTALDIAPITRIALDGFLSGEYDEVQLAYTEFINTLTQIPTIRLLLPIQPGEFQSRVMREYVSSTQTMMNAPYIYEPSDPSVLLDSILPNLTELQIYQAYLESRASEESARMVAMRNATENAKDLISDLTLTYNKLRQDAITKEMLDIAGGAEALAKAK